MESIASKQIIIWLGRIVTLLVALIGVAMVVFSIPFDTKENIIMGLTGLAMAVIGGITVKSDVIKFIAESKAKPRPVSVFL